MPEDFLAAHDKELAVVIPFLASLLCGLLIYPPYIKWLKSKQIEQHLREEGPKSHAGKAKTPTMGGLGFIAAIIVGIAITVFFLKFVSVNSDIVKCAVILMISVLCGVVGFADDFGKVTSKSNKGVSGTKRLAVEFGLGFLLALCLWFLTPDAGKVLVHPGGGILGDSELSWKMPLWLFCISSSFMVAATTNAINLHDGMDGLAGGTSFLAFLTLAVMFTVLALPVDSQLAAAAAGGLAAFLVFNKNPAKVFMGDTGSLFIGGLMAALVMSGGLILWFIPLSLIYIAETISVMMQVSYFKLTKEYTPPKPMSPVMVAVHKLTHKLPGEGKRIFRMAPLHHHFEAVMAEKNTGEASVVSMFWLAQFLLCAAILSSFLAMHFPGK